MGECRVHEGSREGSRWADIVSTVGITGLQICLEHWQNFWFLKYQWNSNYFWLIPRLVCEPGNEANHEACCVLARPLCMLILILSWNITFPVHHSFKVASDAASLGLNTHIVCDAGRTQIAPGSKTVLCVGPGKSQCPISLIPRPGMGLGLSVLYILFTSSYTT